MPVQRAATTSEEVVRCAARLLSSQGPQTLSVRRVARELGVSYQVIYSRFGDKAGMVDALYRRGFVLLGERMEAVEGPLGTSERIFELGQAYRAAALAEPEFYQVMFGSPVPGYVPSAASRQAALDAYAPVVEAAQACFDNGALRPTEDVPDAARLAHLCWGACHGLVSLELNGHHGPDIGSQLVAAALEGMLAPHRAPWSDPMLFQDSDHPMDFPPEPKPVGTRRQTPYTEGS